jgi:polyphosphate kinase
MPKASRSPKSKRSPSKSSGVKTRKPAKPVVAEAEKVVVPRTRTVPVIPRQVREQAAYFSRELSWLAFNRRVLEQAQDERHPLLERVRFLAIVASNLDEFFQIRVAGLIQQVESGISEPSPDGMPPREQLRRIHSVVASLVEDQYRCWHEQLTPGLASEGLEIRYMRDLNPAEVNWAKTYFREQILPVLTPLAIDQAHPFPQLGNKTLNIVATLDNPETPEEERLVAILPVPRILPRIVRVDVENGSVQRYLFLTELIKAFAGELFPGYRLIGAHAFRVTRNSDLYIDEEEAENLLKKIEEELRNQRRGAAVRLEIEEGVDDTIFATLCEHLHLSHEYVFRLQGPISFHRLHSLADIERPDLKYPPFTPAMSAAIPSPDQVFEVLRTQDVMLHHPYDSFTPVVDFVEQAARDPQVFAIKQTLYRTSGDSPIIRALIEASRNGKQVTALVELKARFDEANNIQWARQLEEAGVHVVYGMVGHKIHCKVCLVVRREGKVLRQYAHLGTGNYNPRTARLYTDLSLLTCRENLTKEISYLFNTLTGLGRNPSFSQLLVSPYNNHARIIELIDREAANAREGKPARIMAKMNALVDKASIDHLYAASKAGVRIDLIVRGVCCLVPGLRGLSENIRVRSVVGRFLEHARAFYFENADGEPLILAGSSDWMPRNFFRRVEVVFPVESPELRRWLTEEFFGMELQDNVNARELYPHGGYLPVIREPGSPNFCAQSYYMAAASLRARRNGE